MSKEQAFREQVYRRCCMCKETKRVATDFTPTNRRCTTCGPIYYAKLRERRLAGEPPRRRPRRRGRSAGPSRPGRGGGSRCRSGCPRA